MMQTFCLIFCVSLLCATVVYSRTIVKTGVPDCFKEECPENTLACERFAHLSKDKKHIVAEIHCLDLRGNVLKNVTNYEDNPFEPTTNYKGYSFQGAVQISTMKGRDEYLSKESHGISKNKNTELDDLNN